MSVTINGITAYATKTRGTAQSFIRVAVVNTNDVAGMDTDETAGGSANGTATAEFGGSLVGGTDAGLVAGTYTMDVILDGTTESVSITLTGGESVSTVITAINVDLTGSPCALTGGNLVFTSGTTGLASYVIIADTGLLAGMTNYAGNITTADGGLMGQLKARTLGNGANAYSAYSSAEETYDATTLAKVDYTTGDLDLEAEVIAALNDTNARLNAK